MKTAFLSLILALLSSSLLAQASRGAVHAPMSAGDAGNLKFNATTYDFGVIPKGVFVADFIFTNVGKLPVVINKAFTSCSWMKVQWPEGAISPGRTGVIHVSCSTSGHFGVFKQKVTVISNALQPSTLLIVRGRVQQKPVESVYKVRYTPVPNKP